jgi:hypothetical protein
MDSDDRQPGLMRECGIIILHLEARRALGGRKYEPATIAASHDWPALSLMPQTEHARTTRRRREGERLILRILPGIFVFEPTLSVLILTAA